MKKIISDETIRKIDDSKKYIGKFAIWLVVGVVALSVIAILFFENPGEVIGKFIGSLLLIALASAVSLNNIMRANKDSASVVVFALACLVFNVIWTICWLLLIWQPDWANVANYTDGYVLHSFRPSMLYKIALIASCLSFLCCGNSNIMCIEEYNKKSLIRPLKITSAICLSYVACYIIFMVLSNFDLEFTGIVMRLGILAGFAGTAWVILVIMTVVISGNARIDQTFIFSSTPINPTTPIPQPAPTPQPIAEPAPQPESQPASQPVEQPTPPPAPAPHPEPISAPEPLRHDSVPPHHEAVPHHHEHVSSHHEPIPPRDASNPLEPTNHMSKSEAELRAEIRAEIEAEMRQEAIAKEKMVKDED